MPQFFSLSDVRLLPGPFLHAQEQTGRYLLALEPDRLLHNFHKFAGLETKGERYGGWEARGVAGHTLGHYLSACAMLYAATSDARYRERVDYVVSELARCQAQYTDGYVGGIPDAERVWREVSSGNIRAQGFDLNGAWVPWYTLHKLFAGLIHAATLGENEQALTVATRLGEWAISVTSPLSEEQWQEMLRCEHGGMNDSLAELYALTGNVAFLELSRRFYHRAVLEPLRQGEDKLSGLHANTQIPKVIGAARLFELTGDTEMSGLARFFWERVTKERSFVIGGNSDREHFFSSEQTAQHLSPQTAETCNTYNLLKLTRHLWEWKPDGVTMDFYERALFNHILASQNPESGMTTYFVSLKPGHFKVYNTPDDAFWCCTGSGLENHVKYGESIYARDDDSLYLNLFIASEATWRAKGVTIRQETRFPDDNTARLFLTCDAPVRFTLRVRCPTWASSASLQVNGEAISDQPASEGYLMLEREWKTGDVVNITLPMALHTESLPDAANRQAMLYGPLVLAGKLGGELPPVHVSNQTVHDNIPTPFVPWLVGSGQMLEHIAPVPDAPLTFQTQGLGKPHDVTLVPFFRVHGERYNVYWHVGTQAEYEAEQVREAQIEREHLARLARRVDFVQPGEQQSEADHQFGGDRTNTGEAMGRKWRDAQNGGWFSYTLQVRPAVAQSLCCTYWGDDGGRRTFDIFVNDTLLATETLNRNRPGMFFEVTYPLTAALTANGQITARFVARPDTTAGGLFACETTLTPETPVVPETPLAAGNIIA